ncbi:MAG: DUF1848 domain-containing protein [Methanolinea sp.]|nr:DUF1848 domain-containing protein [Methanolinea sp.]
MRFKGWEKITITVEDDRLPYTRDVEAISPVILSASRATDIPAFYGDWFLHRLNQGYCRWINPWNGKSQYVSFAKTRLVAFWSKNPDPFLPMLDTLDEMGLSYYFLYTLNDYEGLGLEPNLPPINDRVDTFLRLSSRLGKGRVVWRFDPLVLMDGLSVPDLLERVGMVGERIHRHTRRLVISFVDIGKYPKVQRNLRKAGLGGVREFSRKEVEMFSAGLTDLNREWDLTLTACGESMDLSRFGIGRGECIGARLILEEFRGDRPLMDFLGIDPRGSATEGEIDSIRKTQKDPGQRGACGCIAAKDIGQYNTCMHLCAYCYANDSPASVAGNFHKYRSNQTGNRYPGSITGDQTGD